MPHELKDTGSELDLARYRISIAKEDLADACVNFDLGHYRTANNRAYYAIFRAVSACLALKFCSFKKHGQAIGAFNKNFIHTGIFPKEIGRKIAAAMEVRHASDYDDFYVLSIEKTHEQIETAKTVVNMIDEYLSDRCQLKIE